MSLNFTHLHLHTEYSLLDGANKIKDLAKILKSQGVKAAAITDHGNMFGAIDFYMTMKKAGIKPIIGMEAYIHNSDDLNDKSTKQRFHLCLYAKNDIGYKNLMYLSSMSYIDGFYYYPRINKRLLREHSEGLICSSACLQGEVNWHLNTQSARNVQFGAKGYERAKEVALEYKDIFGDDFYLEIMRHGIGDQHYIDEQVLKISQETGIKFIATNDTHDPFKDYAEAHEAFMCIAMNKEFDDPKRLRHSVHEFYIKSPLEMSMLFADIPEALLNTQEIVDKCNLEIKLGNPTPPNFLFTIDYAKKVNLELPEPTNKISLENDKVLFAYHCRVGLEERLKHIPQEKHEEYKTRLEREIDIINKMKFPGYMLIVWDFIREAKDEHIPVGPGRGSAAGSLVAYSLKITDIDPMPYNLLFERFLNPERISMPDIDVDFCQSRRGDIINYVIEKYGRYNVAQVITFGKLLAKGVIRDVARVLGVPYKDADEMAKLIPDELGITLNGRGKEGDDDYKAGAYQKEPKLRELIEKNGWAARVWKFALALEGLNRNAGMHAAGVVISNEELWKKTPLYKPSGVDNQIVTQYSLKYLEDVDLIKFDFLGLKTLTVIDGAIKLIKKRYDKDIIWEDIDFEDENVYKLIQSGHTTGLFQIESSGMQDLNARLKPTGFEDIIAVLALYRPGPMESGMLDDFIERKHGRAEITYMFKELEPILKPTYGVIVYQEQVMQIVQAIGGFSLGESDMVRRAMGKKDVELMNQTKANFATRSKENGFDEQKAAELFDLIVKFAGYGFNKSHSAAYAMITFQTAYLKCYYPQEFMAALLTSEQDNTDKVVKYIDETERLNIKLSPPDVAKSSVEFTAIKDENGADSILFGLGAIKGVGHTAIASILEARNEKQFTDFDDFISRVDTGKVNKKVLEGLIKSGSFDNFGFSRKSLLEHIEIIVQAGQECSRQKKQAENSLFGDSAEMIGVRVDIRNSDEYELKTILEFEKETIGFYISGHPLDDFKDELKDINYTLSSDIPEIASGSKVLFVGKVEEIKTKISKNNNKFLIVTLLDFKGNIEFTVFEKNIPAFEELNIEKPIALYAEVQKDDQRTQIRTIKFMDLKDAKKQKSDIKKEVETKPHEAINTEFEFQVVISEDMEILNVITRLAQENQGDIKSKMTIVNPKTNQGIRISLKYQVNEQFKKEVLGLNGVSV
ncbi:MAG: DNA polymerase III subunit alpha [Campylobacteraceae bacterium]